jgi:arabinose-5-phosphate isomerase
MTRALETARTVLRVEAEAIRSLADSVGDDVIAAVDLIAGCTGRVVVTGMGKAGLVGRKISATFASTGVPAFFLHPAEAAHGDLGSLQPGDLILALSNSGATREIVHLLPSFGELGLPVVAITARADSPLGRAAVVCLSIGEAPEACPIGLAPTTSSTVMLALGDALAMAAAQRVGTDADAFAKNHPGGALGRRLARIGGVMRQGDRLPLLALPASLADAVKVMGETPGRPGCALLVDADGCLAGLFTDGDLRRAVASGAFNLDADVLALSTVSPTVLSADDRVQDAQAALSLRAIDQAPVTDAGGRPVGLIDIQDLVGA